MVTGNRSRIFGPGDGAQTDDEELVAVVALPGVPAEAIRLTLEDSSLVVRAESRIPRPVRRGEIRRLEIPYGRFERAIRLPPGRLEVVARDLVDGCLILRLRKLD